MRNQNNYSSKAVVISYSNFFLDLLNSCWTAVKPFTIPPSRPHPIIEIAELYPEAQPQTAYINHIYVYPLSLAFDAQKNFPRARNITCMVQMFDNDDVDSKPIKVNFSIFNDLLQIYK